jgi:hypothetical protein
VHVADEPAFEPLAIWLARAQAPRADSSAADVPPVASADPPRVRELDELLRDVRVFQARLADAFECARERLLRELAAAVLGRELLLAPVDIAAIAAHLLATHAAAPPLRLRVAAPDAADVNAHVAVYADPTLAPGDAVLELTNGAVDARLGVRLAEVLAAWG